MNPASNRFVQIIVAALVCGSVVRPQTPSNAPPVEVVSFKIEADYGQLLDRKGSIFTADDPDLPPTEVEKLNPRVNRRSVRVDETRARGRLRSEIKVISAAQWLNVKIKNTSPKLIKSVIWDFAFPRYEGKQLLLRSEVISPVEIKPGRAKTLKYQLPVGAQRCQAILVEAGAEQTEKAKTFEAVCGPGFHDPSALKQETVTIKRIEYADGSVWSRP